MMNNIEIAGTISFGGKLLNVYGDLDAPLFKAKDISHVIGYSSGNEWKMLEMCDGSAELSEGVTIGQQDREHFGFSYRTLVGNDESGNNYGYKLHLVYDCLASPSEKNRSTVNDSPDVSPFSWEVSTTPVEVENHKPSAMLTIDSTKIPADKLKLIEDKLYGTASEQPTLPLPDEILELLK